MVGPLSFLPAADSLNMAILTIVNEAVMVGYYKKFNIELPAAEGAALRVGGGDNRLTEEGLAVPGAKAAAKRRPRLF